MQSSPIPDAMPSLPKTSSSTARSSATIVITTSAPREATAGELAARAPSDASTSTFSRLRLYTDISCPPRRRLRAIPIPILPSPINAIFIAARIAALFEGTKRFSKLHQQQKEFNGAQQLCYEVRRKNGEEFAGQCGRSDRSRSTFRCVDRNVS